MKDVFNSTELNRARDVAHGTRKFKSESELQFLLQTAVNTIDALRAEIAILKHQVDTLEARCKRG